MSRRSHAGFTLVEMAVVLVIIGLVMLTLFPALTAMRTANQRALTQSNLRSLMLATASYVQANGCLPCPAGADAAHGGNKFGMTAVAPASCGICSVPEGIPPFVSLGIPASTAHDGWGHWITMRVDPGLTTLPANPVGCGVTSPCPVYIPPASLCSATDLTSSVCVPPSCTVATIATCNPMQNGALNAANKGLCRNGLSKNAGSIPIAVTTPSGATQQAAVLFVSHGSNGYGSCVAQAVAKGSTNMRMHFPNYVPCNANSGFAECNAGPTNDSLCSATRINNFVDAMITPNDSDPYDDILAYADRNTLVSMLGNGSCQTVW